MHTFARMSAYSRDGMILDEVLKEVGFQKNELSRRLGIHRSSLKYLMENTIPADKLVEIGKILRYDLSSKFPKLKNYQPAMEATYLNEPPAPYLNKLQEIEKQVSNQDQAIADYQLEIRLLKEKIQDLKDLVAAKNNIIEKYDLIFETQKGEIERLKSGRRNGDAA